MAVIHKSARIAGEEDTTMDAATAWTVIPATVGLCGLLHLLLDKGKNERITFLKEQLEECRRKSPDVLAQTLHGTVKILKEQLIELNTQKDTHLEEIKAKEAELQTVRAQIDQLTEQIDIAGEVLEEYKSFKDEFSCPHCDAPIIRLGDEYHDAYKVYECGYLIGDQHNHPCPHDPEFPKLNDYELEFKQFKGHPGWLCSARPRTEKAGKLELDDTHGDTREEAEARMIERYNFLARDVPKQK